jgi:AMIN domain
LFCAAAKAYIAAVAALVLNAAAPPVSAAATHDPAAEIRAVAMHLIPSGAVLEITSSRPVTPQVQIVEQPLRLVIDLPEAKLVTTQRKLAFHNPQIKSVRLNQYQTSPEITRIVVDLTSPVRYNSEISGNQIHIHLLAETPGAAKPPSIPAFTSGVQPAIVPMTLGNSGSLVEAGNRVASGSSITAGEEVAVLRLARGGEVRVCPGTTLSVTASSNGQDLMLGMNQGSIETHYVLEGSVDSVVTPDFRIVLPGPGAFNLAVRTDRQGNTCVGSMAGSTSSAVVAEMIGNGTYEIKPEQEIVFRQGRLDQTELPLASCGCPRTQEPVLQASISSGKVADAREGKFQLQNSPNPSSSQKSGTIGSGVPQAEADAKSDPTSVVAEAPLVFRGLERAKDRRSVVPAPLPEATALPSSSRQTTPLPTTVVLPPTEGSTPPHKNLIGRVKGFFGTIFR